MCIAFDAPDTDSAVPSMLLVHARAVLQTHR